MMVPSSQFEDLNGKTNEREKASERASYSFNNKIPLLKIDNNMRRRFEWTKDREKYIHMHTQPILNRRTKEQYICCQAVCR
jgi:hypothetical protein